MFAVTCPVAEIYVPTFKLVLTLIVPVALKLPTLALPLTLNVPVMLAPVPVTTRTFALPTALILTLPFDVGILTLLFPFDNELGISPVKKTPLPKM